MPVFQVHIDDGRVLHIEADDSNAAAAVAEHYVANEGKSAPLSAQRLGESVKSAWDNPTPGGPLALVKALHSGVMGGAQLTKDVVEGKVNPSSPEGIGRATQSAVDLIGTPLTGGATTAAMMLAARARAKAGIVPPTPEPAAPRSALSPYPPREPSSGPSPVGGAPQPDSSASSPVASLGGALLNLVPMVRNAREVGGAAKRVFDQYFSKPPLAAPEASAAGPRPIPLSPRRIEGYPEEPGAPWGPRDPDASITAQAMPELQRLARMEKFKQQAEKAQNNQTTMEAMPQIRRLAAQAKAEQTAQTQQAMPLLEQLAAQQKPVPEAPPAPPPMPTPEPMAQAPGAVPKDVLASTQALARGMQAVAKMRAQSEALQGKTQAPVAPQQAPVAPPPAPPMTQQQPPAPPMQQPPPTPFVRDSNGQAYNASQPPPPVQQQPAPMAAPVAPQPPAAPVVPPGLVAEALARAKATQQPQRPVAVNGSAEDPSGIPDFLRRTAEPIQAPVQNPVAAIKALTKANGKVTVKHATAPVEGEIIPPKRGPEERGPGSQMGLGDYEPHLNERGELAGRADTSDRMPNVHEFTDEGRPIIDVAPNKSSLLSRLAEVKGRDPATAYSQDNARQIDLLHHTSEGMGPEDASYHITDMMKELGKTVRNRDDHAAYLAPFIKSQDTLAADVSRVTGIPIEKLVPHLRAIGTHGPDAVRAFRERLQEFEPERASRIAEVLSDQRIKQIWRKK